MRTERREVSTVRGPVVSDGELGQIHRTYLMQGIHELILCEGLLVIKSDLRLKAVVVGV